VTSTFLTLLVLPSVYPWFAGTMTMPKDKATWLRRSFR
jgi:hypothetical protein